RLSTHLNAQVPPAALSRSTAEILIIRTSAAPRDVRFWPIADIANCTAHVRFWGQSGQAFLRCLLPLLTQSGHCAYRGISVQLRVLLADKSQIAGFGGEKRVSSGTHAAARVHHGSGRPGGCLATCCACAEIVAPDWLACVRRSNIGSN